MEKKTVVVLLVFVFILQFGILSSSAEEFIEYGDYKLEPYGFPEIEGYNLIAYMGKGGDIVLPDYYKGVPVTDIRLTHSEHSFNGKGITSLIIPDTYVNLGNVDFVNNQLTEITVPGSIRCIPQYTFYSNLIEKVTLNEGVEEILTGAFRSNFIVEVTLPKSLTLIKGDAFGHRLKTVKAYKDSYAEKWALDNGYVVENITELNPIVVTEVGVPDKEYTDKHLIELDDITVREVDVPEETTQLAKGLGILILVTVICLVCIWIILRKIYFNKRGKC